LILWWRKKKAGVPFEAGIKSDISKKEIDINSGTWEFIVDHLTKQIQALDEVNRNPNLSIEKTQEIRGQIKANKQLLDLPETTAKRKLYK
jgi:hypothetical protein